MAKIQSKQINRFIGAKIRVNAYTVLSGVLSFDATSMINTACSVAGDGGVAVTATPSNSNAQEGVVVATNNLVTFWDNTTKKPILSVGGNEIFGEITHASGVYTIHIYELVVGVKTPYSFGSDTDVDFDFPYRYSLENLPTDFFISNKTVFIGVDPNTTINGASNGLNIDNPQVVELGGVLTKPTNLDVTDYGLALGIAPPPASVGFEVRSTTKGTRPFPRMSKANMLAIASPAIGLQVYQTDEADEGLKFWNGVAWIGLDECVIDDLYGFNTGTVVWYGNTVMFNSSLASGLIQGVVSNTYRGLNSAVSKVRRGIFRNRLNTNNNARCALHSRLANYHFQSGGAFYIEMDCQSPSVQIDFANDPVLQCWGLFDSFLINNLQAGVYFRFPRTGETQFVKCCLRISTVEVIFDSTIPYVYDALGMYARYGVYFDGTDLYMIVLDGNNTLSITLISNLITNYPILDILYYYFGVFQARNGNGILPVIRDVDVDRTLEWTGKNHLKIK